MVFTSKSGFLRERTPVVTHRYSVKGYPMTSSHICVWKRKEIGFESAVAFLERKPWNERTVPLAFGPPLMGLPST